ncbi:MAG TPA: hypothetical protein DEH78_24315 [Solibacterales bacterium]|nr:hypothetical protein [Bryobacterales bacterium]
MESSAVVGQDAVGRLVAARKSLVQPTAAELAAARQSLDLAIASLSTSALGEKAQAELRREMRHIRALLTQAAMVLEEWQTAAWEAGGGGGPAYGQDGMAPPHAPPATILRVEA